MFKSTTLNRFKRHLLVAGVVAGAIVPAAGAVTRPPDVQDAANALYSTTQGIKADGLRLEGIAQVYKQLQFAPSAQGVKADGLRLQGMAQAYQQLESAAPDVFERYATSHPFGAGLSQSEASRPPDVRDVALGTSVAVPDVFERYAATHPNGAGLSSVAVSQPPDIADTALTVRNESNSQSASGFNWGDWAIGIGSGMGIALLLGAGLVTSRQVRQRVRTA
jgi:hypothetical protein